MTTGYTGTPLAHELGLERGMRVWFHKMPQVVRERIDPDGLNIDEQATASAGLQGAHIFVTERSHLERELPALRELIAPNGFVWVSWPAPGSATACDIDDGLIRETGRRLGLVEAKTCAIDEAWCGLKLVIAKEQRDR